MGPGALLMLLLFFSQHCEVFVCREQERYSLSLSAPGSRPGWNPAPKRTSRQRRRAGSHLAVPAGYFHAAASPLRRFAGGERRAGAARSAGVRSQPPWRLEEGFSSSDVTEPRGC